MKERQRWRPEEDALLRAYVKQYGPREWQLVSQRMNAPLQRDAKSCQERWKNYLEPGVKRGSLTEDEQRLVIRLQAKHGNKWKEIAAEVPGRTAKRLGKWWEVYKEKQQRELSESRRRPASTVKYNRILETFAEKIVEGQRITPLLMAGPLIPPWFSDRNISPSSPSVSLTLSPAAAVVAPSNNLWIEAEQEEAAAFVDGNAMLSRLSECCKGLEEGYHALAAHRKEAGWRLRRVEQQLEAEKACKQREKTEEFETKMRALRNQQQVAMERIDVEFRERVSGLRTEADAEEQRLADRWAAKRLRMSRLLDQAAGEFLPLMAR